MAFIICAPCAGDAGDNPGQAQQDPRRGTLRPRHPQPEIMYVGREKKEVMERIRRKEGKGKEERKKKRKDSGQGRKKERIQREKEK